MKVLKIILGILIAIIALPLIIALFIDRDSKVEREIVIEKPKQEVFQYLRTLKNQPEYSKWAKMDEYAKRTFTGADGQVGSKYAWESDSTNVGRGEQTITAIIEGERVDYELHFIEPFESKDNTYFIFEEAESNKTKVIWGYEGKMKYPMNLMKLFMDFDEMLGSDFQYGLDNAKKIIESK
jgi:hypothetical protein